MRVASHGNAAMLSEKATLIAVVGTQRRKVKSCLD